MEWSTHLKMFLETVSALWNVGTDGRVVYARVVVLALWAEDWSAHLAIISGANVLQEKCAREIGVVLSWRELLWK